MHMIIPLLFALASRPTPLITIPITLYENIPLARVHHGEKTLYFVIDSAAKSSLIDNRYAVRGAATLRLDGITLNVPHLGAIDLASQIRTEGHAIDGVLGGELFAQYVVQLDYDTRVLRLFERDSFVPDPTADAMPLVVKDGKAYVRCVITMPGAAEKEELFLIDPGSAGAISHPAFARADVAPNTPPRDLGRAERFRIGRIAFDQVNGVAAPNAIGDEVLHRFTITFDYGRGIFYLEPARHFGDAWMFDMSGANLQWNATRTEVEVSHVFDATPAAEAGLNEGDCILAIDHQPVTRFDLDQIVKMFHEPRAFALDVRRGSRRLDITIVLRKLL